MMTEQQKLSGGHPSLPVWGIQFLTQPLPLRVLWLVVSLDQD